MHGIKLTIKELTFPVSKPKDLKVVWKFKDKEI